MTLDDLKNRTLRCLPGGAVRFDPLTLLLLGAIVSSVVAHYVERGLTKCEHKSIRNPGWIARWQLRREIRRRWSDPEVARAAVVSSVDAAALDRMYGDDVHKALLSMAAGLTDAEIQEAFASR